MNIPKIKIAWTRRSMLKPGETTDQAGFAPVEFSFNTGQRESVRVKRIDTGDASAYQRVLFASPVYLTRVEVYVTEDWSTIYIYAWPDQTILKELP